LERDAGGFLEALRGRGVEVSGVRGRAILLSPLLASALERGLNLAEAMEARGYGRTGRTSLPRPRWRVRDSFLIVLAAAIVTAGALWL
jgi:energy-coupling factor transport system permease protein